MPSTYSTSLGIELIGNGEQAGTWGTTTNNNLGTLLEQAIAGVEAITLTGDYTLTDFNGLIDESRNAVLVFNGSLGAPANVTAPSVSKTYIVRNVSGATVTVKTSTGNGVAIANAASELIFCDSTNFFSATQFNFIEGNLTVTGTATANNVVATNNITLGKDLFANSSTDQIYLPVGTTAQRTGSPIEGVIRYNSEGEFYEGYANGSWVRFLVANQGSYTITYLAVGGGGGGTSGGGTGGGGGGGGQMTASTTPAIPGTTVLTITIGGGGAVSTAGTSSVITGVGQGVGGGAGAGKTGGTSGNGFAGGTEVVGAYGNAGGGGGAGGAGSNGFAIASGVTEGGYGGAGGVGAETLITGTSQILAGGGGGGGQNYGGSGQNGGGKGSGGLADPTGTAGTVNTGGGGGGGGGTAYSGGSGVVFLSMPTVNYTGVFTGSPTVTTSGSNTVLRYTASGTYTA